MFGIDFSEIVVIFAIALIVLGPQKLPKLAASIGRWVGRARSMARQFREQLEQEAHNLQADVDPHLDLNPTSFMDKAAAKPEAAQPAQPAPAANAEQHERGA